MKKLVLLCAATAVLLAPLHTRSATHTWTGASTNGLWTNPGNWQGNSAPVLNESPLNLTFPPSAARKTVTNNFNGLAVDSILFQGGTWNVHGSGADASLKLRDLTGLAFYNLAVATGAVTFHLSVPFVLAGDNAIYTATNTMMTVSNVISGTGNLTKWGTGELLFNGVLDNTYTGSTYVTGGTLTLRKAFVFGPYISIPGPLYIGLVEQQTDFALRPTVRLLSNEQIASNAPVTLYASGRLLLADHTQTIGLLAINSGELDTGTNGLLKLTTNIVSTNMIINNMQLAGQIEGRVDLGDVPRSIRVQSNALHFYAHILGQANATLEKRGPQVLRLLGSNSYAGLTIVREGTVAVDNAQALGSIAAPTVVSNGAAIWLENGVNIAEPFILNGFATTPWGVNGALFSVGTNTCSGDIVLASDADIATSNFSDYLTLTGYLLGPGGWEKHGAGTVKVSGVGGPNKYGGVTRVYHGTLVLDRGLNGIDYLAVPGALQIGFPSGGSAPKAEFKRSGQVSTTAAVTMSALGTLSLNSDSYHILGSLAGSGTVVFSPAAKLLMGYDDTDTVFNGKLMGGSTNGPNVYKFGMGIFDFGGINQLPSVFEIHEGAFRINGLYPSMRVEVFGPAEFGGAGNVSNILVHAYGVIAPGANTGNLHTKNFAADGLHSLHIELNGPADSTGYDQFEVDQAPDLSKTALEVTVGAGFSPTNGQKFTIFKNNSALPLSAPFLNLTPGQLLATDQGYHFSVDYASGNGNDVELTLMSGPARVQGIKITPLKAVVTASGIPGAYYWVEASDDLSDPDAWVPLDYVAAGPDGVVTYEDTDSPSFSQRFYRFLIDQ